MQLSFSWCICFKAGSDCSFVMDVGLLRTHTSATEPPCCLFTVFWFMIGRSGNWSASSLSSGFKQLYSLLIFAFSVSRIGSHLRNYFCVCVYVPDLHAYEFVVTVLVLVTVHFDRGSVLHHLILVKLLSRSTATSLGIQYRFAIYWLIILFFSCVFATSTTLFNLDAEWIPLGLHPQPQCFYSCFHI